MSTMKYTGHCFGGPLDGTTATSDRPQLKAVQPTGPHLRINQTTAAVGFTTMEYRWAEYAWVSPWQRAVHQRAPWMVESTTPRIVGCWLPTDQLEHRKRAIDEQLRAIDYVRRLWAKASAWDYSGADDLLAEWFPDQLAFDDSEWWREMIEVLLACGTRAAAIAWLTSGST